VLHDHADRAGRNVKAHVRYGQGEVIPRIWA
jgi:hypothetical protein